MSKVYNISSKKGQELATRASRVIGKELKDVYKKYSDKKHLAYMRCYMKAMNTEGYGHDYHISSANCNKFSVAWTGQFGGQSAIFLETADNSYIVNLEK